MRLWAIRADTPSENFSAKLTFASVLFDRMVLVERMCTPLGDGSGMAESAGDYTDGHLKVSPGTRRIRM